MFPISILSPKILRTAVFIVFDNLISRLENSFGGTVILLQQNNLGLGIIFLEVQDILHISTTPTIDRLVRIPNHTDVFKARSQEFDQLVLSVVGILVLINMDVLKLLLVVGQNIRILIKETQGQHNQIIKVNRLRLTKLFLISSVTLGHDLRIHISSLGGISHIINQIILSIGNGSQNSSFIPFFRIQVQLFENAFHERSLFTWINNCKITVVANMIRIATQNTNTHGVEGRNQTILSSWIEAISTLFHLTRSLISKGNGQDIPRIDQLFINQISNAVGQNSGLSRTSPRHD